MPLYELVCDRCNGRPIEEFMEYEELKAMESGELIAQCPKCGNPLRRAFSTVAIVGDTCAGNRSFEGWDESLGMYVRGRSHREHVAKERGMIEYRDSVADLPGQKDWEEARYINSKGNMKDPETRKAMNLQFKRVGDSRRQAIIRKEFANSPEITRDDIARTQAEMNKE